MSTTTGITVEEMVETLTGFDEIAIGKAFPGFDIYNDGDVQGVKALRALAFVQFRRGGANDPEAKDKALGLTLKAAKNMFIDEDEDLDPDHPETESGKDDSEPA